MASLTRRVTRMINRKSQAVPHFDIEELEKLDEDTLVNLQTAIAEVDPDHEFATPPEPVSPVVETVTTEAMPATVREPLSIPPEERSEAAPVTIPGSAAPPANEPAEKEKGTESEASLASGKARGTYCTLADGREFGPFKNQGEAKEAIKLELGLPRMPAGAKFSRI